MAKELCIPLDLDLLVLTLDDCGSLLQHHIFLIDSKDDAIA